MLHSLMESSPTIARLMFFMLRRLNFVVLQKTLNCHSISMHVWGNWENNHYVIESLNCHSISKQQPPAWPGPEITHSIKQSPH
ncbi:hypothetical protein QL285_081251 [Trifolium repens]|nr:hypothetical protein QL285_081251 [Trifolium repens]